MATRIYLPSSGAAAVTPTNWLIAPHANNYTYAGVTAKINSAFANRSAATGTTGGYANGVIRYVLGPLAGNTISGNVSTSIRCYENAAQANATLAMGIHIIQANGANRSTLLAATYSDSASSPYEFTTTLSTKRCYTAAEVYPVTMTNQTPTAGDYLVIELGYYRTAGTTDRLISINVGDNNANDCPNSTDDANAFCPWVEFANNIDWYAFNNYNMTGDPGAYILTGQSTEFLRGYAVEASPTAYNMAGTWQNLAYAKLADLGSYAMTGQSATLSRGWTMTGEAGAYVLSGQAATLLFNRIFNADAGSYSYVGIATDLLKNRRIDAEVAGYVMTGISNNLLKGFAVEGSPGTYSISGISADLLKAGRLDVGIGAYAIVGQDVTLGRGRFIVGDPGAYIIIGQDATLTKSGGPLILQVEPGIYSILAPDASLLMGRIADAGIGQYAYSGQDISTLLKRIVYSEPSQYLLSGLDSTLLVNRLIAGNAGTYSFTGLAATLLRGWIIIGDPGTYTFTGQSALTLKNSKMDADAGAYLITGTAAQILMNRIMAADPSSYGLTGKDADLLKASIMSADPGIYILTGQDVTIAWGSAFVVPIILRVDGRAFIKDLEKRVKVSRLEVSPKIIDIEKRR